MLEQRGRWRVQDTSLRELARTAPYLHDGTLATLRAVVDFDDEAATAIHTSTSRSGR